MFKKIKTNMMLMNVVLMTIIVAIVYIMFTLHFENYYFERKLNTIEKCYKYLESTDISKLKYNDDRLVRYRDRNIKILIADQNFENVIKNDRKIKHTMEDSADKGNEHNSASDSDIVISEPDSASDSDIVISEPDSASDSDVVISDSNLANDPNSVNARIEKYIKRKADTYKEELKVKNKKNRICGWGIITQGDNSYYVYIYETKMKVRIGFSYTRIFLLVTGVMAIGAGIIVSIIISRKITKPINDMEEIARTAPDKGFKCEIDEEQKLDEFSSLARSINTMFRQIRSHTQTLEDEIRHKTIVEEKRKQFVNNVSHEMKTPLAIISSQVEMLALIDDEEKRAKYCESIVEETNNMSEMINDMIAVYASENGNETMELTEKNVGELLADLCNKYDNLIKKNNIEIKKTIEDGCVARVNERYIIQALDNYLTNAIKHSPENEYICVRALNNKDFVRIEVENHGPGISEEAGKRIWDRFYKGDDNESLNGQKGSGLGLYLVKSIVELHGGNYGYNNTDNGIIFWIELPKA